MKRSLDRILTTHAGSLPRPDDLLEMTRGDAAHAARVRAAVADVVRAQAEHGIDVVDDGEMSKPSFVTYVTERLAGFEPVPEAGGLPWAGSKEVRAFPEFYASTVGASPNAAASRWACTGPVRYVGRDLVAADVANLRAALAGARVEEAFLPAISPSNVEGRYPNRFYRTDEEYLLAIAEAMAHEYRAIVDAGFLLQDRRPAAGHVLHHGPRLDGGGGARVGRGPRGGAQPRPPRHPARPRALPHLLQHQHGPAGPRHGAPRHRRRAAARERGRVLVRGREPAPRARVASVARRDAARGRRAHPRRDHPVHRARRAPGPGGPADRALRIGRGSGACDCRRGLRLRHLRGLEGDPPAGGVGQARRAGGRRRTRRRRLWA